jgi:predicted Zn-dependent protease
MVPEGRYAWCVRLVAWLLFAVTLPLALGGVAGALGALAGALAIGVAMLWVWLWLPRRAHAAFDRGQLGKAARRYRTIAWLTRSRERARAALLSQIGCHVAAAELEAAERLATRVDPARLDAQERAVWLNNRACIALARGDDPHGALALIDEATALRPDVPALQHTRGSALLAVGRVDDAIAVLDGMRAAGELAPRLEAERCADLARAWTQKGETAYADDYRMRADALSARP